MLNQLKQELQKLSHPDKAKVYARFFKTGKGEIGKRDEKRLINFLDKHYKMMPRTSLRYAIERLDENKRKFYLRK